MSKIYLQLAYFRREKKHMLLKTKKIYPICQKKEDIRAYHSIRCSQFWLSPARSVFDGLVHLSSRHISGSDIWKLQVCL